MDWLVTLADSSLTTLSWLAVLALTFGMLAWAMPCNRGMHWWRDLGAALTDVLYWFVVPVFTRAASTYMLAWGIALLLGGNAGGAFPVRYWPWWQQCLAILALQDVLLYWIHRAFHTKLGWSFHAIHHSPRVLDWPAAARFHVVNKVLAFTLADVVVLLLGFPTETLVALVPFNLVYSCMVHANVNWTFGPLRYVLASPVFHRWHHTVAAEAIDKNFASTFPLLDLLFGTFYMPPRKLPQEYGNGDRDFPEDFWGQFLAGFWRTPAARAAVDTVAEAEQVETRPAA